MTKLDIGLSLDGLPLRRTARAKEKRSIPTCSKFTIDSTVVVRCDHAYAAIGMTIMTVWNNIDARLRDLRVLSVVLREHNLTRAAEVLNTTQPAISKALARLRGQFRDPLFVRNGNAMHPTSRALEMGGLFAICSLPRTVFTRPRLRLILLPPIACSNSSSPMSA